NPPASDVSVSKLLAPVFGGLVGGGADPLAGALGVWNAGLLFVGGVLLSYGIIAGTMQTAHDGEVLGKRWSSMWMPIRTSIGVGAIVPTGAGYCVIQTLVMWLALQGVGLADNMWSKFADTQQDQITFQAITQPGKGNDIAVKTLNQLVCLTTIKSEYAKAQQNSLLTQEAFNWSNASLAGSLGVSAHNPCGSVSFDLPPMKTSKIATLLGGATVADSVGPTLDQAHKTAYSTLQTSLATVASDIYNRKDTGGKTPDAIAKAYTAAVNAYNASIQSAAESAAKGISKGDLNKNLSKDGWALAGAWYIQYSRLQAAMMEAFNRYPVLKTPNLAALSTEFGDKVKSEILDANSILGSASYNAYGITKQAAMEHDPSDLEKAIIERTSDLNMPMLVDTFFAPMNNPVLGAAGLGEKLVDISITMQFIIAAIAFVMPNALATVGISGAGAALTALAPFWYFVTGGLLTFGSTLQFFVPMLPFVIWFGIVIGWLVLIVEAVIAAPLWAVMHIHPDGDGVVGKGGQGYSLVLALTLRPALAILGLAASMVLIYPIGTLFNEVFWSAFALAQGGAIGIVASVASVMLYTILIIGIVKKTFNLSHTIGDAILQWIGGPSGSLGSYSKDLANVNEGAAAATGAVAGGFMKGIVPASSKLGDVAIETGKKKIGEWKNKRYENSISSETDIASKKAATNEEGGKAGSSGVANASSPDGGSDSQPGGTAAMTAAAQAGAAGSDEMPVSKGPRNSGAATSPAVEGNSNSINTANPSQGNEGGSFGSKTSSTSTEATPSVSTSSGKNQGNSSQVSNPGPMTTNSEKSKTKADDDTIYTPKIPKK
ncbi:DotA/TraY family protein, partial [Flavobacterium sp.]|uniref:DotA/TraY family protein n=1 Tax=Flavobacterium sp. TaxID=239 RepID=UPI0037C00CCF